MILVKQLHFTIGQGRLRNKFVYCYSNLTKYNNSQKIQIVPNLMAVRNAGQYFKKITTWCLLYLSESWAGPESLLSNGVITWQRYMPTSSLLALGMRCTTFWRSGLNISVHILQNISCGFFAWFTRFISWNLFLIVCHYLWQIKRLQDYQW